jgi:hypothetical protein
VFSDFQNIFFNYLANSGANYHLAKKIKIMWVRIYKTERHMEDTCASWKACAMPLDVKKYPSSISLEVLPCPILFGVAHIGFGGPVCHI